MTLGCVHKMKAPGLPRRSVDTLLKKRYLKYTRRPIQTPNPAYTHTHSHIHTHTPPHARRTHRQLLVPTRTLSRTHKRLHIHTSTHRSEKKHTHDRTIRRGHTRTEDHHAHTLTSQATVGHEYAFHQETLQIVNRGHDAGNRSLSSRLPGMQDVANKSQHSIIRLKSHRGVSPPS
jgi:hypothetical protein